MYDQSWEERFAQRINQLRTERDVSARRMSLDLEQNDSYINRIENGKAFPSMQMFFDICAYLGISPKDFFDDEKDAPIRLKKISQELNRLDADQLDAVLHLVSRMK